MNASQFWILFSVTVYMAAMLWIGFWSAKKIKNTKDYIVAGNRLGWWLSIGTIFATWFGAETCMGASRTAYEKGILGVIADPFGAGLCLILAGLFFIKHFRKLNVTTIVDFFKLRYGQGVAKALSILYIPVYIGWVGAQILAFGTILTALTGLPEMLSIYISTAVVLVYSYKGGMWAVSITDLVQMIILVIGFIILFPIILMNLGGWKAAISQTPKEFFDFHPRSTSVIDWLAYVQAWIIVGLGSLPGQDLFQRVVSPKNAFIARWSAVISGVFYIFIGLLPVFMGIFGRLAFPEGRGASILLDLSLKYLPAPLIGVMVGALLAAIMSTVSGALLAPASIIGHNLVPYFKPGVSEETQLKWCRWSILLIGGCSLALALYFKNIYTLCTQSWGILLAGVVAPMIAGVYWKKANTYGAISSAVSGTAAWILFSIFLPENYPSNLFGLLVSTAVLITVSLATSKTSEKTSEPALVETLSTDERKVTVEEKEELVPVS